MPTPPSLRDRASGSAVAVRPAAGKTVADLIEAQKGEIARALPKHLDPDRLARIAVTVVKQTKGLSDCDPTSLLGALMTCAQLGLEPGPLGEAYFVPYGRKVTFIPGYKGLLKLAWQSGLLRDIYAEIAYEHDDFRVVRGLKRDIVHEEPQPFGTERGKPIGVYAVAHLVSGGEVFVVLTVAQVEAIRGRSASSRSGPWVTDWEAMAKKTAVRQLVRWLPMSTSKLEQAAALDGTVRSDFASPLESSTSVFLEADPALEGEVVDAVAEHPPLDEAVVDVEDPPANPWPEAARPGSKAATS